MSITTSMENIGPAEAEALLENHPKNRKLSDARVKALTGYMQKGLWHFDGDPIRIGENGELLDGQHRLQAILASGLTFEFLVIRGLKSESQLVMNTGKSRTLTDQLDMRGEKDTSSLAALLVMGQLWESGRRARMVFSGAGGLTFSFEESLAFFESQADELRYSATRGKQVSRKFRVAPRIFTLCVWIFRGISEEDAEYFFDRLTDGIDLEENNPILVLREKLLRLSGESGRGDLGYLLALMFKAWNAYRSGQEITLLNWRAGGAKPEPFPEPK